MSDDRKLDNVRWERFCNLFVFGNPKHDREAPPEDPDNPPDTQGNATQSYIVAGYKARGAAASSAASRLLKDVRIQARIRELRDEETRIMAVRLRQWKAVLPKAQDVLIRALEGEDVSAQQIQAAKEVIEQAVGPTRFRFGVTKDADADGTLNVTLWSGRNRGDDD